MKRSIEGMRDCVKRAFNNGSQRGHEFRKMRHAITVELFRLVYNPSEIKDALQAWNKRCEKVLPPGEQKRQLLDYVDWCAKHECHLGCQSLEEYCIGQENCSFHKQKTLIYKKQVEKLPLDLNQARDFLIKRYQGDGYVMSHILHCLRFEQIDKVTGEGILIGYRRIASLLRDRFGVDVDPMTVYRRVQDLISEGMLEVVVKGQSGTFGRPANGYRFLRWDHPQNHNPQRHNPEQRVSEPTNSGWQDAGTLNPK